MLNLPEDFLDRMQAQLGEEFDSFLACFDTEGYAGLRVNTGKISVEKFLSIFPYELTPVPWTSNGFYYRKEDPVTKHPYYYAGLYYIQEPSAMLPASRLPVQPGQMVLDLCAAPGGKATELSSRLGGKGLLVTNDASASRAKALVKNLAVWGSPNCCITGETPEKLLERFGCSFDRILVDAPCSGEGMFRKDSGLIESWKERGPEAYAPVQTQILDCAVQMLRPGGMIAYSTCTFAREEDEAVIEEILHRYPELSLADAEPAEGFVHGAAPCEKSLRIWPHHVKGEGHFLALLRKADSENIVSESGTGAANAGNRSFAKSGQISAGTAARTLPRYSEAEIQKNHRKIPEEILEFLAVLPEKLWKNTIFEQIGEQCLLLPPYQLPGGLRYLRTGILLGTLKRGRFEPSQALAMLLQAEDFPLVLDLSAEDERVIRYLKGETVELSQEEAARIQEIQKREAKGRAPQNKGAQKKETSGRDASGRKGWILICVDGFGLGWGKYASGSVKNKYYPGWRLQ